MKFRRHPRDVRFPVVCFAALFSLSIIEGAFAQIQKENNTDALSLTTSWFGGSLPTANDIAQWNNLVLGVNTADLGADLSWLGIRVLDPGGNVTITGLSSNILTLGIAGIDLSAAKRDLTISSRLSLGAAQTWTVAAGRVLQISTPGSAAVSGIGPLTVNGPGQVRLGGLTATYTFTGGISLSGGTGAGNVAATPGNAALISAANLVIDGAAITPTVVGSSGPNIALPALTVGGGTVHTIAGARASGTGAPAWVVSGGLVIAAGNTNFTQSRGTSARAINQFSSVSRAVGGTVNFRDVIDSTGLGNANGGGYRMSTGANVNGIVPFATYTPNSSSTTWFVAAGTGNNGTAYAAFTASTGTGLGATIDNSTVVTDVSLTTPAIVNSVRFDDIVARTVAVDPASSLTIGAGAILVTNTGTAAHAITGGTLMGGNPGSGSGNDLIIFQNNNTSSFTITSVIADNVTPTALTKSGAGTLVLGGVNTYTGGTFVNAGTLLVNGSLHAASATLIKRGGILGGTGTVNGSITLESGGKLAPGADGIGALGGSTITWNSDNATAAMFFDLSSSDNTADAINLSGNFTKGSGSLFLWNFQGGVVDQTYTLANFTSTNFANGDFGIATAGYTGTFTVTANTVTLQLLAVPEPGTLALLLGGAGALTLLRFRRSSR